MTMTDPNDKMLDDLFAQARAVAPPVPNDLMARVLADADAAQRVDPVAPPARGLWRLHGTTLRASPEASGAAASRSARGAESSR